MEKAEDFGGLHIVVAVPEGMEQGWKGSVGAQTGGTLYKNGVGEREIFHHQTFSRESFQIKAEIP